MNMGIGNIFVLTSARVVPPFPHRSIASLSVGLVGCSLGGRGVPFNVHGHSGDGLGLSYCGCSVLLTERASL